MAAGVLFVLAFAFGACTVDAQNSLRSSVAINARFARTELSTLLGHGDASSASRLGQLKSKMESMYRALPKNVDGGLDNGVARYALHRFFIQQHGWNVKGLMTTGADRWSESSPLDMFSNRVPDYVLNLVEERLGGSSLGLGELAILAATLEDLVHSEAMTLVSAAFTAQNTSLLDSISKEMADLIVQTYMLFHIKPHPNYTKMTPSRINMILSKVPSFLDGWQDTMLWVQDLENWNEHSDSSKRNPFSGDGDGLYDFDSIVSLVEDVGEGYGQFQNIECMELKSALLTLEDQETGRVRLSNFYHGAMNSDGKAKTFRESADYLRHLGALDESDPKRPSVIVPNYLYSQTNCLAASGFYSVCCINECEALMAQLESNIAQPLATPQQVADVVAAISSDTIMAPRNLSASLLQRLDDIANENRGEIPLHGRLFAQWMHHAFPNECPYPHVVGSLEAPLRPSEWMQAAPGKRRARATEEDMAPFLLSVEENVNDQPSQASIPWTHEEELIVKASRDRRGLWWISVAARLVALGLAIASAGLGMLRMMRSPGSSLPVYAAKKGGKSSDLWSFVRGGRKSHFV